MRGGTTTWLEPHSDALKRHVENNHASYADIAKLLNDEFGTSYSRNAAIGRAGRMGLINPHKIKTFIPKAPKEPRPRAHNSITRIIASNSNSNSKRVIRTVENAETVRLRCVEIVPRNLSLLDLEPGDCRYPYGEEAITFCGHPKVDGSSYCGPHEALTHKPLCGTIGRERPDIVALNRRRGFAASCALATIDAAADAAEAV